MTEQAHTKSTVSRRNVLGALWAASLVALFGQAGAALYQFFAPRVRPGGFGGKVVAGKVNEFKPGTVSHIQDGHFYLSRLEDGSALALWQRCTHLGCTVPWRDDEKQFHCPCHSSLFNTKGEVIGGPAPRPMDYFPIEIVDGNVVVDTGNPQSRDTFNPAQTTHF